MIQIQNVEKRYGKKEVLKQMSFQVQKGEIVGLLGRNGAGKSTLMNIMTGYIPANSGTVLIGGIEMQKEPQKAKELIGYLPEQPPLYETMTVEEYLLFVGSIRKIERGTLRLEVNTVCERMGLLQEKKRLICNLSKGYRQRVGIAQAMIGSPQLLVLDEPTSGLDPLQIVEIRSVIKEFGRDKTILISSHIISEITEICGRILIVDEGVLVADVNKETQWDNEHAMHIRVNAPYEEVEKVLQTIPGLRAIKRLDACEVDTSDFEIVMHRQQDVREALFDHIVQHGLKLLMLAPKQSNVEDLFLELTEKGA